VNTLKRHLSVANVLSIVAVFIALSATAVAATKLSAGQVKAVNIANEAVTNPKLKNLGVTSSKIANGTIVSGKLKGSAVTSGKLGKEAVTAAKIKKKAVGTNALAAESVTGGKIGPEAITAAKLSSSLYLQLIKNVTYVSTSSVSDSEANKSATATCPAGKQAIGGGVRLEGELAEVATTASYPVYNGSIHNAWSGIAHETGPGTPTNWSVVAFAVCAEL
jgi:trimeric autotransporter adhesin